MVLRHKMGYNQLRQLNRTKQINVDHFVHGCQWQIKKALRTGRSLGAIAPCTIDQGVNRTLCEHLCHGCSELIGITQIRRHTLQARLFIYIKVRKMRQRRGGVA